MPPAGAQRVVYLDCDADLAAVLAQAVGSYARAAYPPGGSECAQASREALLAAAESCARHAGGQLALRKRLMAQVRAAVNWYTSDEGRIEVDIARRLNGLVARRKA